jgi:hypothetical protein
VLLFFTKNIAYPHDGIYLFLRESRQQARSFLRKKLFFGIAGRRELIQLCDGKPYQAEGQSYASQQRKGDRAD